MKHPISVFKALLLTALIALPILALTKGVDGLAEDNLDGALTATGAIYATARGINALVSMLQGTELDFPLITLSIGQILDPINDLIERFATVVLFALGAIAAQKVLLMIVASSAFNYILTGVAILSAIAMFTRKAEFFSALFKIFVVIVFVRFALCIVVIANHWVDQMFFHPQDQERHQAMESFQEELKAIKSLATNDFDYAEASTHIQNKTILLESTLRSEHKKRQKTSIEIEEIKNRLKQQMQNEDKVCQLSIYSPFLSPTCAHSIESTFEQLKQKTEELEQIEANIEKHQDTLKQQQAELDCLNKRSIGETCTFWDHIPDAPDINEIRAKIDDLENQLTEFTENAWLLLTSLLLKSVLIPILFLYGLIKFTRYIWMSRFDLDIH